MNTDKVWVSCISSKPKARIVVEYITTWLLPTSMGVPPIAATSQITRVKVKSNLLKLKRFVLNLPVKFSSRIIDSCNLLIGALLKI